MWRFCAILLLGTLLGCSTPHAVRVRCDRHLVPINPPVASDHGGQQSARGPEAKGEHP